MGLSKQLFFRKLCKFPKICLWNRRGFPSRLIYVLFDFTIPSFRLDFCLCSKSKGSDRTGNSKCNFTTFNFNFCLIRIKVKKPIRIITEKICITITVYWEYLVLLRLYVIVSEYFILEHNMFWHPSHKKITGVFF